MSNRCFCDPPKIDPCSYCLNAWAEEAQVARKWSDEVKALQETLQEIDLVLNLVEGRQLTGSEAFEQINHLLLLAGAPNSNRQEHIRQKVQDRFA